ncbi:MAG: leucine-rich repeat domain-containing protein [Chloroflexi bacterium]|nr:leucine-rich repeat domain-containing protein [Chloroflexota bacterium]
MFPRIFLKSFSIVVVGVYLALCVIQPRSEADHLHGIIRLAEWRDPKTGASLNLPFDTSSDPYAQAEAIYQTTYLDLSEHKLTMLPPEIGYMKNLKVLVLWGNSLTELPPEMGSLSNLKELHLNKNNLRAVPPEIGNLESLTILYMDHNELTSVPGEMARLKNLQWLNLSHNQLTSLPQEFSSLVNLRALYVRNNQVVSEMPLLPSTLVYQ